MSYRSMDDQRASPAAHEGYFVALSDDPDIVQLSAEFPLTLTGERTDYFAEAEVPSSQDPSYEVLRSSPPLGGLSSDAEPFSEEGSLASSEAGTVGRVRKAVTSRTFVSAEDLRRALQPPQTNRGTQVSRMATGHSLLARSILESLKTVQNGWCRESTLATNKKGGYVQVSHAGKNKFAILQDVLIWAHGREKADGEQVSHLCHHPRCTLPDHVCLESAEANNNRKGCVVWTPCSPHCSKCNGKGNMFVCPHQPGCILAHQEYVSQEEFEANGICCDRSVDLRERKRQRQQ